jgi:ABC-type Co2+ transport system permease subunit
VWIELGALGLVVVGALFAVLLYRALRRHFALTDRRLVPVSAALVGLAVWTVVYAFKAQYLDYDPLNVYFWLFLGMAFKLGELEVVAPVPARADDLVARERASLLVGEP